MNLIRRAEATRQFIKKVFEENFSAFERNMVDGLTRDMLVMCGKINIWEDYGSKTFILSKELVEAFQHTDIPFDIYPTEFQYPLDCFLIESDVPIFQTTVPTGTKDVYSILYLSKKAAMRDPNARFVKDDGTEAVAPIWDKSLTAFYESGENEFIENMMMHLMDTKTIQHTVDTSVCGGYLIELTKEDAHNMVNLFYNTIMYINDPDRRREETEVRGTRKIKIGSGKEKRSCQYILLKPPRSYKPLSAASGRTIDVRFVVRGHYKNQAHGERMLLRKRIWIQPYMKGDYLKDAPSKPYKII